MLWGYSRNREEGVDDSCQILKSITFQVQLSRSHLIFNSSVLIGFLNFLLWKQFQQKLPFHGKLCPIFLPNLSAFVVLEAIHKWMRLFGCPLLFPYLLTQLLSRFLQLQLCTQVLLPKLMPKEMVIKLWPKHRIADDPELDAQVPAAVPPGQGQRHPPAALLHLQDLRLQGADPEHVGGLKLTVV